MSTEVQPQTAVDLTERRLNNNARLTIEQVKEIKRALANGEKGNHIAERYPITKGTIYCIARGEIWKDIEPA